MHATSYTIYTNLTRQTRLARVNHRQSWLAQVIDPQPDGQDDASVHARPRAAVTQTSSLPWPPRATRVTSAVARRIVGPTSHTGYLLVVARRHRYLRLQWHGGSPGLVLTWASAAANASRSATCRVSASATPTTLPWILTVVSLLGLHSPVMIHLTALP